jgi:hypothetical protein
MEFAGVVPIAKSAGVGRQTGIILRTTDSARSQAISSVLERTSVAHLERHVIVTAMEKANAKPPP